MKIGGNSASKERGQSHQLYVPPAPITAVAPPSNRRAVRTHAMSNEQRYKENRNIDLEKSRSLDSEYERYQYSDFDKSRSFDEDYGESSTKKYLEDNRSFSIDQVYSNGPRKAISPPNYSSGGANNARLYEHELMYEMARSQRSPIIDTYKRQQQKHGGSTRNSRKRSPNLNRDASSYRSMSRNMEPSKVMYRDTSPSNISTIVVNHSTALGSSGGHTSPGSDYDGNVADYDCDYEYESGGRGNAINDELIKEAKLVTDFLYGSSNNNNKSNKADSYLNSQRRRDTKPSNRSHGASSSGVNAAPTSVVTAAGSVAAAAAATARYIRN